jgi:hypothetical protein
VAECLPGMCKTLGSFPALQKKKKKMVVLVLHAYNSNRMLSGGLKVQGQPGQHSETLSRKKKEKNRH